MSQEIIRSAEVIASEINAIKTETFRFLETAYSYANRSTIEIGKRLTEAKEIVPQGEWTAWLEQNVSYSVDTAQNLMRIFREYSDPAFEKLGYSQLVAMFALPAPERKEFVEQNAVEDKSAREIKELIKQKADAERNAIANQNKYNKLQRQHEGLKADVTRVEKLSTERQARIAELEKQLSEMQNAPREASEEQLAEIRAQLKKELEEQHRAEMQKDSARQNPRALEVNILFSQLQTVCGQISARLTELTGEDSELGKRMEDKLHIGLAQCMKIHFGIDVIKQ